MTPVRQVTREALGTTAGRAAVLDVATRAARDAAALVLAGWRTGTRAEHKGRVDLVTKFDRASEDLLRARLTSETPFAFVGEELGGERAPGDDAPTWYVDPLDGTTNFVHGHFFYCVSVGLVVGRRPLLGVVVAPSLGVAWTGIADDGAWRNGEPCRVSAVDTLEGALVATGFPYDRGTSADNNFDAFEAIKKKAQGVRRCGAAAIDVCLVADGTYDGYWEKKLWPWDVAAGAAIVLGAGGQISDYGGAPADLLNGRLVATNGHLHGALIAALDAVPSSHLPPVMRLR
jgi:myo-inositol-1(or 4)-monophosphatase